jgi:2-keto-4-pentenoate hydratase/2-oxohepta-3-ene-1,7-dioic acid hydratase in catechol pathway
MKIVRYEIDEEIHYGVLEDDGTLRRLKGEPFERQEITTVNDAIASVRVLTPVPAPRIFGVGLNYVSHIKESGQDAPKFPMLFMKPSTAAIGNGETIIIPDQCKEVHFEGELAVIIGKTVRYVSEAEALDAVFGYTCANDLSDRPIQFAEMATGCLLIGKGFDTFCPLGPLIATDIDPTNVEMVVRVNNEIRQQINTSDLLFSIAQLISYLSQAITLLPGDVIITGTPSGVGPVAAGDIVDVEIDGIGILRNPVAAEASSKE